MDMNSNKKFSFDILKPRFLNWIYFLNQVEKNLQSKGFQKVVTPYLVTSGALESQLEPFDLKFQFGAETRHYQLPTSPEFSLKLALALGLEDVFEIKSCFRNHELSPHHNPEFTMLEFYKNNVNLSEFVTLVLEFIQKIIFDMQSKNPAQNTFTTNPSKKRTQKTYKTNPTEIPIPNLKSPKILQFKICDLFQSLGHDLKPDSKVSDLKKMATTLNINFSEDDTFDDLFFRIWLEKIEPGFDPEALTLVRGYPPSQAALSRIDHEGWAERFEIYWKGLELGNAFFELKGSKELKSRWKLENEKRVMRGLKPHPVDHQLIEYNQNLPDCCGIAIGLERLFMAILGYKDINEFKIF